MITILSLLLRDILGLFSNNPALYPVSIEGKTYAYEMMDMDIAVGIFNSFTAKKILGKPYYDNKKGFFRQRKCH